MKTWQDGGWDIDGLLVVPGFSLCWETILHAVLQMGTWCHPNIDELLKVCELCLKNRTL